MKSRSELQVGSFLVYPKGADDTSQRARHFIRYKIKMARQKSIVQAVEKLSEHLAGGPLAGFFPAGCTLVPAPGHAPRVKDGLWVADAVCQELVRVSLAGSVLPCLERVSPVARSSKLTRAEDRPSLHDHRSSLRVADALPLSNDIVLVDDVVTRGATLLACARLLAERFPSAQIKAFALARTIQDSIEATGTMIDPALETISVEGADDSRIRRY